MITELYHSNPRLKKIMEASEENQRLLFYAKGISDFTVSYCETENDKKWYSLNTYRYGYDKKLYYRKTATLGLTYENKKIKVWFGGHVRSLICHDSFQSFLSRMGVSWAESLRTLPYVNMFTKTALERIFNKKINNIDDFIIHWVKYSWRRKDIDIDLIKGAIKVGNFDPFAVKVDAGVFKDPNQYLQQLIFGEKMWPYTSLISYAKILDIKIDFIFDEAMLATETERLRKVVNQKIELCDFSLFVPKPVYGFSPPF
jgi:hypothetical protein